MSPVEQIPKDTSPVEADGADFSIDYRLFLGFLVGIGIALLIRVSDQRTMLTKYALDYIYPVGGFFLRMLLWAMAPYIFFSITTSIANLGAMQTVRRISLRLVTYYLISTTVAILIGQTLVSIVRPGDHVPHEFSAGKVGQVTIFDNLGERTSDLKRLLAPARPDMAIPALANGKLIFIFVLAIVLGFLLTMLPQMWLSLSLYVLRTLSRFCAKVVEVMMHFAPLVVCSYTLAAFLRLKAGFARGLIEYVLVVVAGLTIHMFGFYPLVLKYIAKYSPREFFKRGRPAILAAFFSGNVNAIITVTSRTLQKGFAVPESITNFCVPLGSNFNLDGTALFEVVTVVFLAQVYQVGFSLLDQVALVFFVLFTAIGLPGIPGGSMPILTACLSVLGIPIEGVVLILGMDGFIRMLRSAVNVAGDMVGAIYVCQHEKIPLLPFKDQTNAGVTRLTPVGTPEVIALPATDKEAEEPFPKKDAIRRLK